MTESAPSPRNASRAQTASRAQCPCLSTVISRQHTWVLVLDENIYNIKTKESSAKKNECFVWLAFRTNIWGSARCLPEASLPANVQCPLASPAEPYFAHHGEGRRVSHRSRDDESCRVTKAKGKRAGLEHATPVIPPSPPALPRSTTWDGPGMWDLCL